MRESNFSFPSQNRACVCISSGSYDRRAIDAPAPSLPLVNSLTHLSYLTATSPRIREILSIDGGLERLVRITKGCAAGPPPAIEENLARLKGKGMTLAKGARKSPFKAFSEYKIPRSIVSNSAVSPSTSTSSFSRPSSLFAEKTQAPVLTAASKQLLYTYTLAFQCIVNIGVRGSEQIRTRVVEAGALDVVVHVLERYLEGIDRRRISAEAEHKNGLRISNGSTIVGEDGSMGVTGPLLAQLEVATAEAAGALSLIVTASVEMNALLEAPQRVNTPDTIVSMEDDVAESSGQDMDGDGDATEGEDAASNGELLSEDQRSIDGGKIETIEVVDSGIDGDGDVSMEGTGEGETERMEIASPRLSRRSISGSAAAGATGSASLPHLSSHHSVPSNASATTSTTIPSSDGGLQYRDEDVLLSLQLLAYLSKYPHVRSVFHSPSEIPPPPSSGNPSPETNTVRPEFPTIPLPRRRESTTIPSHSTSHTHSHAAPSLAPLSPSASHPTTPPTLSSNVFSLVESFTHRPSNADKFTPRHTNEVQYWAGVIMRNACRKDETQNGIRQCANMQCGQWETFPREFAKCRRCRKAKYCSKGCQSKAWQLGHRYWCAKAAPKDAPVVGLEREGEQGERHTHANRHGVPMAAADSNNDSNPSTPTGPPPSATRRSHSHREHHSHHEAPLRSSTTAPFYEEDDELEDVPPPSINAPSRLVRLTTTLPHIRLLHLGNDGPGTVGDETPTLDEDEIARGMMLGGNGIVYGDLGGGAGGLGGGMGE